MARAHFVDTVMYVDEGSGDLRPANNARVSVYAPGTTNLQTIYTTRSAGTTKANPFTTDATGAAEFWAELADYDVKFEDLEVPARFGPKTIGWQSSNAISIPFASLDAVTVRQTLPIGAVIAWWRPNNTVGLPAGCVSCDGATYSSAQHDFGTGASITVPDLRNRFIVGANSGNTDGQAGSGSDTSAGAPGIRGAGGSNVHTLTSTQMPVHSHTVNDPGHIHAMRINSAPQANTLGMAYVDEAGNFISTEQGMVSATTGITIANSGAGSSHNNMPFYVGLLYIIKIKRD